MNFFVNPRDLFFWRTTPRWAKKLHFFWLFFRFFCKITPVCREKKVEEKTSAVNMKKPEKSRKKSKNSIFSVFLAYFSKSPRYIENLKKNKSPRYITFSEILYLFSWLFFLDIPGWFCKKSENKVRKNEVCLHILGQFFEKTSLGDLRKNWYTPEKMKKNSKKNTFFFTFFCEKTPY